MFEKCEQTTNNPDYNNHNYHNKLNDQYHRFHNESNHANDMKNFDLELRNFLNENQHYLMNDSYGEKNDVLDDLVNICSKVIIKY